jgi:hypothetical protein
MTNARTWIDDVAWLSPANGRAVALEGERRGGTMEALRGIHLVGDHAPELEFERPDGSRWAVSARDIARRA